MITHSTLVAAFRAAADAAEQAKPGGDGGTCNFDTPVVHLPRMRAVAVNAAAKEAGISVSRCSSYGAGHWFVDLEFCGQADMRTRMARAATEALKDAGLSAMTFYMMD